MRCLSKLVGTVWIALSVAHCSSSSRSSVFGSGKNKSEDGRRPSEQGEGIAGYLTDPASVRSFDGPDGLKVSGSKGTVVRASNPEASPAGIPVCLKVVTPAHLDAIVKSKSRLAGGEVVTVASGVVDSDGAFALTAPHSAISADRLVALDVSGGCDEAGVSLEAAQKSVAFARLGDASFVGAGRIFENLESLSPSSSFFEAATGSPPIPSPTPRSLGLLPPIDQCPPSDTPGPKCIEVSILLKGNDDPFFNASDDGVRYGTIALFTMDSCFKALGSSRIDLRGRSANTCGRKPDWETSTNDNFPNRMAEGSQFYMIIHSSDGRPYLSTPLDVPPVGPFIYQVPDLR